ncbi:zinc finger BED domain-containing protein 4-like protein, partial [Aphelenchoides avenae]
MNVSFLKSHLATAHPEKFKQLKAKEEEKKKAKPLIFIGIKNTIVAAFAKQSSSEDADDEPALKKSRDSSIVVSLGAKRAWSEDGEMTAQVNRAILEMMAADIQPLSLAENTGFQRLLHILQPQYKLPSRFYFTKNELPARYDAMK